jgi:hypothetical protein
VSKVPSLQTFPQAVSLSSQHYQYFWNVAPGVIGHVWGVWWGWAGYGCGLSYRRRWVPFPYCQCSYLWKYLSDESLIAISGTTISTTKFISEATVSTLKFSLNCSLVNSVTGSIVGTVHKNGKLHVAKPRHHLPSPQV